jgi:hypothetical protein
MSTKIPLTQGKFATIDDEDFARVGGFKWYALNRSGKFHVMVSVSRKNYYIHRMIMDAPPGMVVDHINGDGLDNRKSNLRICHHNENIRNRTSLNANNASGAHGVYWDKSRKRWCAEIKINYKRIYLGRFCLLCDAVEARHDAELDYYGDFCSSIDMVKLDAA